MSQLRLQEREKEGAWWEPRDCAMWLVERDTDHGKRLLQDLSGNDGGGISSENEAEEADD